MAYAKGTSVDANRSKAELETLLDRFGCDDIFSGKSKRLGVVFITFFYAGKKYGFDFKLPNPDDFLKTEKGRDRALNIARKAYEQAERESWRLLVQMVKMTILWVESKNETFERAFASRLLTAKGGTAGDLILENSNKICAGVELPKLLNG